MERIVAALDALWFKKDMLWALACVLTGAAFAALALLAARMAYGP